MGWNAFRWVSSPTLSSSSRACNPGFRGISRGEHIAIWPLFCEVCAVCQSRILASFAFQSWFCFPRNVAPQKLASRETERKGWFDKAHLSWTHSDMDAGTQSASIPFTSGSLRSIPRHSDNMKTVSVENACTFGPGNDLVSHE